MKNDKKSSLIWDTIFKKSIFDKIPIFFKKKIEKMTSKPHFRKKIGSAIMIPSFLKNGPFFWTDLLS